MVNGKQHPFPISKFPFPLFQFPIPRSCKNDLLALTDSDNILPSKDWLGKIYPQKKVVVEMVKGSLE